MKKTSNNNNEQYKSNIFNLVPALFTITNIYVENVSTDDAYYTAAYGGSYPLKVKINAEYDISNNVDENGNGKADIIDAINVLEEEFSSSLIADSGTTYTSTWYKRLYTAIGAQDEKINH